MPEPTSPALPRRAVLIGLAASVATMPGCLMTPPVRRQYAMRGRDPAADEIADEIDRVGEVFRAALYVGFEEPTDAAVAARIGKLPVEDQPVGWEAASMAVAWLERSTPAPRTWAGVLAAGGAAHEVSVTLGLGWALSWLRRPTDEEVNALPPLLRWRVLDGYGFRDGMVAPRRFVRRLKAPPRIDGFGESIWRQGLGRSLWYTTRADVDELAAAIEEFPAAEQVALWRGVGVAATYIGSLDEAPMVALREGAGGSARWLALGCALACRTRRDAHAMTARQTAPCAVLAGSDPTALAAMTDRAEAGLLDLDDGRPAFQRWMDAIGTALS